MNYFENHRKKLEESKKAEGRFRNFCINVYENNSLSLEPSEKIHFESLREIELNDYTFRKRVFWPLWGLSFLLFDQIITMPSSKSNKSRLLFNIMVGTPFVTASVMGLVFYRDKIESQVYALTLCDKYKSCDENKEDYI
ncbi:hypothetical protein SteCoe_28204 [Stentor coeruleus]|uniref:Uncharacterized protein n=1 Tax=Stentor coeruleus TaxID=5963 RepID=A0A1R2B8T8_9CILI|nr:hypothetical protein SteCoe_28204 [Stentor coeruleus]